MQELRTPAQAAQWLRQRVTGVLDADSRKVVAGDGFVAWPGAAVDVRRFVPQAMAHGATACLVEHVGVGSFAFPADAGLATYTGLKADAGRIASEYFGTPSAQLAVVAVTGTNGKTSTAWWLAQALSALPDDLAIPCGVIGTLGVGQPPRTVDAMAQEGQGLVATGFTTPDPVLLQRTLREFADAGLKACAIEASSIGIEEHRLNGTQVRVAIFTNFTQDHLDYHGSMEAYGQAKRKLFGWPGLRSVVANIDDVYGVELVQSLSASALDVWSVSVQGPARLQARNLRYGHGGLCFEVVEGDAVALLQTRMIGSYNVSNVLGVLAAMRSLGVPLQDAVTACSTLHPVPGRMECLGGERAPLIAVDYAHTPDALGQAIAALRPLAAQRGGRLWCVFGCGGDRDSSKRPLMGAIAAQQADQVVVTSDNPRSEKPEAIIAQILLGLPHSGVVDVQVDRALAIADAVRRAGINDVVLVAGKGHESTQEIAGTKHPFSDREHAQRALRAYTAGATDCAGEVPMMRLGQVAQWMAGAHLVGPASVPVQRVHSDTRSVEPGDLFVALKGERYDANAFLHEAMQRGAVAVVCHGGADPASYPAGLPRVEVADTKAALGELAAAWRRQFSLPLIAVTGSNGKTTVTQMLAAILEAYRPQGASLATLGNLNNDIGVPLTLLRLRAHHAMAVVELGMNHPGEIAALAAMAQPTVALVNNAQREHLEFMHTVQAVAQENGAAIAALGPHGVAVFPADDDYALVWQTLAGARRTVRFAQSVGGDSADLGCVQLQWEHGAWRVQAQGLGVALQYRLSIAGRHNVKNSLAAAACALAAGVPVDAVVRGLESFVPVKGRSRALELRVQGQECTLVDDTYNANPDSVRAAIDVLAELPGPRLLVLGDMGEVGQDGPQFHAEAARYAREQGIDQLYLLGELTQAAASEFPGARHFDAVDALNAAVCAVLPTLGSVLVKGSRFMRMERVVDAAVACAQTSGSPAHVA